MIDNKRSYSIIAALGLLLGACGSSPGHGEELSPDAAVSPADDAPAAAVRYVRVTGTGGDGLNLRGAPNTSAEILTVMPEGAVVPVVGGPADGWYELRYLQHTGSAFAEFLIEVDADVTTGGVLNLLPWTPGVEFRVTQGHNGGSHTGYNAWAWDFGLPVGTLLLATHNGTVRAIRAGRTIGCCSPECGEEANFIIIARGDGVESLYLHLKDVFVSVGDTVTRGDPIGTSGETGYVCGAHLHFQMQSTPTTGDASYRPSVPGKFHDLGMAFDPVAGTRLVSKNGVLAIP